MDITFENKERPKKGKLLISEPFLEDDFFGRAVIYLCEHNEEGSFGFVLNNYLEIDLTTVTKNFPIKDAKISMGGPVETDNIYFMHSRPDLLENSELIDNGLFIGGDYSKMIHLLETGTLKDNEVRFFLGYSGWSPMQLEEELAAHSWLVVDADSKDVMNTELEDIWTKYMKEQGKKFELMTKFPINPQDN